MTAFLHVLLSRLKGLLSPRRLDRDFDDELASHLSMAEERNLEQGMSPEEARRKARIELGGLSQLREAGRETRSLPVLFTCWLDAKLGFRMLARYWGLTAVGGLSLTVAFTIAALFFGVTNMFVHPGLSFEDGERIVALQNVNTTTRIPRLTWNEDFERWRDRMTSVEEVGAFRDELRTLTVDGGPAETVSVAEMTVAGWDLTRTAPLLGRVFGTDDVGSGANAVVVIGYEVWQTRFSSDPAVIGRSIRLDGTPHTVIGVMPEDFAFPVNHSYWVPLQPTLSGDTEESEAGLFVFARLVDGATIERAQAELETVGIRASGANESDLPLRQRILPYTQAFGGEPEGALIRLIQFLVSLVVIPPCANIAILVYARTIVRQEEFSARYALGAGRWRIVWQLFLESLVLTAAAGAVALALVGVAFRYVRSLLGPMRPFWLYADLSWTDTAAYLGGLALAAAVIVGALPAIGSTGRLLQPGLQALGSRSAMRLGATWTVLVVLQVAIVVAALPSAFDGLWYLRSATEVPGFAREVLTARLRMDRPAPDGVGMESFSARFGRAETELVRQIRDAPGVRNATITATPGGDGSRTTIEIENVDAAQNDVEAGTGTSTESRPLYRVSVRRVREGFFEVFDRRLLSGRDFGAGDLTLNTSMVIVSRALADIISANNGTGRRLRYVERANDPGVGEVQRWYEIVGVVLDPTDPDGLELYHPASPGRAHPAYLAVDFESEALISADLIRSITASIDPALNVDQFASLDSMIRRTRAAEYYLAASIAGMTLSVLFLSAAGIHALMSVVLNHRRHEIGIRLALGALSHQLVNGIFRRTALGLLGGALGGVLLALVIRQVAPFELEEFRLPGGIPATALLMVLVGLIAAFGPVRRALRVDPNETLRDS